MAEIEINGNGDSAAIQAALSSLGDLEKDFAEVELRYRTVQCAEPRFSS